MISMKISVIFSTLVVFTVLVSKNLTDPFTGVVKSRTSPTENFMHLYYILSYVKEKEKIRKLVRLNALLSKR
jgi:hypothetical protein